MREAFKEELGEKNKELESFMSRLETIYVNVTNEFIVNINYSDVLENVALHKYNSASI